MSISEISLFWPLLLEGHLVVQAGMIICYAGTGRTASLIAKYRPSMPILALVVPRLRSRRGLSWELEGRYLARQFLIVRGAAPNPLACTLSLCGTWHPLGFIRLGHACLLHCCHPMCQSPRLHLMRSQPAKGMQDSAHLSRASFAASCSDNFAAASWPPRTPS